VGGGGKEEKSGGWGEEGWKKGEKGAGRCLVSDR